MADDRLALISLTLCETLSLSWWIRGILGCELTGRYAVATSAPPTKDESGSEFFCLILLDHFTSSTL
jgi:hypothetical protein